MFYTLASKPKLIIDPGHGGRDPGAVGNGITEKNYTLDISAYQFHRFQELGVPVAITRSSDVTLDPNQRTALVRRSGAQHCISNHINAGGGDGAEFIHSIFSNDNMAQRFKTEILNAGQNVRRIFTRKGSNGRDYYYMHRETGSVETVIVEYGFLDNSTDARQIKANWERYAEAVVEGYCKHIGHKYTPPKKSVTTPPAPGTTLHRVQIGAFSVKSNAERLEKEAESKGFRGTFIHQEGKLYKVQVGAFGVKENADSCLTLAKSKGFKDAFID